MGETVTRGERKRKIGGRKRQKSQGTPQGQQRSRLETLLPSRSRPFQLFNDAARMRALSLALMFYSSFFKELVSAIMILTAVLHYFPPGLSEKAISYW
uniref:Uncharacterized protein n=1 Tax=Timema shepardi TaxID=629360 RepID=A0A7R9G2U7_TIMSH|nr:unnamed protein product [Timema shepardi]